MSGLERSYRRLLAGFPADHRHEHEQEMLGLLLSMAEPGQRRPRLRDVLDLLYGAGLIRLRRARAAFSGNWRDALAVAGVIAAVLQGAHAAIPAWDLVQNPGWGPGLGMVAWILLMAVSAMMAAVAAVCGRRSLAMVFAWSYAAAEIAWIGIWTAGDIVGSFGGLSTGSILTYYSLTLCSAVLTALAVTLPPGPRRGIEILGRRRLMWASLIVLATLPFVAASPGAELVPLEALLDGILPQMLPLTMALTVLAALAGRAARSPVGRRAVLLLAIPAAHHLTITDLAAGLAFNASGPVAIAMILLPVIAFGAFALRRPASPHRRTSIREI